MSKEGICGVHLKVYVITQTYRNRKNGVETALHDSNSTFIFALLVTGTKILKVKFSPTTAIKKILISQGHQGKKLLGRLKMGEEVFLTG